MPATKPPAERKRLHARIRKLLREGLKVSAVAERCECSRTTVYHVVAKPPRGAKDPARRSEWLAWRRAGASWAEIMRKANVSRPTAWRGVRAALEDERKAVES